MDFRLRDLFNDDEEAVARGERLYDAHLNALKPLLSGGDLWRFFGSDFFHDGAIEAISIASDLRTVSIRMECPNIQVRNSDGDFDYVGASFTCHFDGVDLFQIDASEDDLSNAVYPIGSASYGYAEIDTLTDEMAKASHRWRELDEDSGQYEQPQFHSLIIATDRPFDISIVFQSLTVQPDEPAAFELMARNPNFTVPLRGDE